MAENKMLEYKDLEPSEVDVISEMYHGPSQKTIRVGPKGYIMLDKYKTMAEDILGMELREGDVFVASYQRSGTTWTQELVWLVANDFDYETAAMIPLVQRYPFLELSMLFDEISNEFMKTALGDTEQTKKMYEILSAPAVRFLAAMPSPRFIKTHLPMSLLPPKILETTKVVYVARDPKDVAVSCFHHARLFTLNKFQGNFRQIWNAFLKDLFTLTPFFEHLKEAWALKDHPNMLFLFYEDLSKDLPASIRRVADFLGKEVTPAQMKRLCEHLHIDNFKNNKSVNNEDMREIGLLDSREQFVRKGKSGGWRDYFDEEMTQQADRWIKENLKDTDLRFPSMSN